MPDKPHSTQNTDQEIEVWLRSLSGLGDSRIVSLSLGEVRAVVEQRNRYRKAHAALEEQFDSVLSLAEHLFQMIPQEVWRDHGAEWMGQYEGDHHAEQVLEQLRAWRGSEHR